MPFPYNKVHDKFIESLLTHKKCRFISHIDPVFIEDEDGFCFVANKCLYINSHPSENNSL